MPGLFVLAEARRMDDELRIFEVVGVTMRAIEQHKAIQELRDYIAKMSPSDRYDFEMFQKRDRDDEELDAISSGKLEAMQKKYIVRKTKKDIEEFFRKMSSGNQGKVE